MKRKLPSFNILLTILIVACGVLVGILEGTAPYWLSPSLARLLPYAWLPLIPLTVILVILYVLQYRKGGADRTRRTPQLRNALHLLEILAPYGQEGVEEENLRKIAGLSNKAFDEADDYLTDHAYVLCGPSTRYIARKGMDFLEQSQQA